MKKLFLTSQASKVIDKIVAKLPESPSPLKVAFIPTAGDPYGNDKPWMDLDRAKLVEYGMDVVDFDLKEKTKQETREGLATFDIIFVAGGNTFYLLDQVRKSGFDKVVKERVEQGTIYIGSSAGSYIVCPTIEAANWKQPGDKNFVGITDFTALDLVDFLIIAHYEARWKDVVEQNRRTSKYPVVTLTNEQMVVVEGKNYKVV